MNDTNYTREEVNNAILKVLTTQFKRDAKESHKIVEEAGYEIYKYGGSFGVKNPKTHNIVRIDFSRGFNSRGRVNLRRNSKRFRSLEELKPIDFVGNLDTTRKAYCEWLPYESEAHRKYDEIKRSDCMAMSYDEYIKKTLDKLASLQKDLIRYTQEKADYEQKARDARKKYGLI